MEICLLISTEYSQRNAILNQWNKLMYTLYTFCWCWHTFLPIIFYIRSDFRCMNVSIRCDVTFIFVISCLSLCIFHFQKYPFLWQMTKRPNILRIVFSDMLRDMPFVKQKWALVMDFYMIWVRFSLTILFYSFALLFRFEWTHLLEERIQIK